MDNPVLAVTILRLSASNYLLPMKAVTKQTYLLFWRHMRKYRVALSVIVISIALGSALVIANGLLYKRFFDVLSGGAPSQAIASQLVAVLLMVLAVNGGVWLMFRIATLVNNFFQPRVIGDLTNTCFDEMHQHSFGFFINRFVGALVRRVGRLTRSFEEITDALYWNMLPLAVRIIVVLAIVFAKYPSLGGVMIVWMAIYLGVNYSLTLKKLKLDEASAASDSRVTGYLADTITNQANMKVFTSLRSEQQGFRNLTDEQFVLSRKSWDFDAKIEAVQAGFMFLLEFAVFYGAVRLWQKGMVTVGDFVFVQVSLIQLFEQFWHFGRVIRRVYRSLADAEEMVEIINQPRQVVDLPQATELTAPRGQVEFNNVSFTYTDSREVIKGFNLSVKPGERVGIVGPSGAGKSTLVALIFRFFDVRGGKILIDGQDIARVTQESLRRQVALVPQDPVLFHRSLMDNIRYGRAGASDQEVFAAARQAHCDEFINRLPQGYQTYVGERGVKLSGGERQRVAIARAILKNAPVLVLDEATSSLDSQTESVIQDALEQLMKGRTTIVIAHRLSTIMKLDRIVVVREGEVQETGTHKELITKDGGLYRALWELQAGGFIT